MEGYLSPINANTRTQANFSIQVRNLFQSTHTHDLVINEQHIRCFRIAFEVSLSSFKIKDAIFFATPRVIVVTIYKAKIVSFLCRRFDERDVPYGIRSNADCVIMQVATPRTDTFPIWPVNVFFHSCLQLSSKGNLLSRTIWDASLQA